MVRGEVIGSGEREPTDSERWLTLINRGHLADQEIVLKSGRVIHGSAFADECGEGANVFRYIDSLPLEHPDREAMIDAATQTFNGHFGLEGPISETK